MKVAIVSPYYFPATVYGGPVESVKRLVRGIKQKGIEPVVITTNANGNANLSAGLGKVDNTYVCYNNRQPFAGSWQFSLQMASCLEAIIDKVDILHIQGFWTYPVIASARLAIKHGKPFIISPRGTFDSWALNQGWLKKRFFLNTVGVDILGKAARIQCLSKAEMKQVLNIYPRARVEIIPNGITPSAIHEDVNKSMDRLGKRFSVLKKADEIILFMSRLHPKKGVDIAIESFAIFHKKYPNSCMIVAGPDETGCKERIENRVIELGIGEYVVFTGMVKGLDKHDCFSVADIFVLPSYSEGLPVVVLEAMSYGIPVVISEETNIGEEVQRYNAGNIVKISPLEVARGLARVNENRKHFDYRSAAQEAVVMEFEETKIANMQIKLYKSIMNRDA